MANCVKCGRKLPSFFFAGKLCKWCVQYEAAQRDEEPKEAVQPIMPVPWAGTATNPRLVTHVLVGINVAVFAGMVLSGISLFEPAPQQLVQWGANFGPRTVGGEWWRLLTCAFVHIGIIHIAFNMWCLWDLGALAEALYGHWTFAGVYLISGVGASLTSLAWHANRTSAGASGAIFGLAGALIASFYLGEFSLPREAVRGILRSVVIFAGYNLFFGAVSGRTDNAAHIGGLIFGLILGALIVRLAPGRDAVVPRVTVLVLALLAVVAGAAWLQHVRGYLVLSQWGTELIQEGKADEAVAELRRAVRQRPDYVPAHYALAHAYSTDGQLANAESEWQRVIALQPSPEAYYGLGIVYLQEKRPSAARDTFSRMLLRNEGNAAAHFGLGMAAAAEANYPLAVREYRSAAGLDPAIEGLYYNLGLAFAELHQYDDAIAAYLEQRQYGGDDYDTEIALASAYRAKGMRNQAEDAQQRADRLKNAAE
jgi:rhomboid protease GluP